MQPHQSPRIRRTAHNTQFTYNLPGRIYDVKTYPVLSPQGATIIIYGHDNGLTIAWRGGRRFAVLPKQVTASASSSSSSAQAKRNGAVDDSVMIIDDSDDDQQPPPSNTNNNNNNNKPLHEQQIEFEDEIQHSPYPDVIQTLDLVLGTAALHIAVLPMTPCAAEDAAWAGAEILREKMVLAVSCSTNDAYVVTLPLTPPSPASKARPELRNDLLAGRAGSGAWGESVVLLAGQASHSDGIAMTVARPKGATSPDRLRDQTRTATPLPKPRVVVAAHTKEAAGTLRLWNVPLDRKPGMDENPIRPFQSEYLPAPLRSISFNPSHLTQILAVFPHHAARIYDYALPSIQPDDLSNSPFPSQGSWLLSLHQPFARPTRNRKPILDAAWIARGRAVLVVLADGMWGIWDVDGASPSGPTILGKQTSGIRGAGVTSFGPSGYVEGTGSLRGVGGQQAVRASTGNDFAPMTPHTRRDVTASLGSIVSSERLAATRGGITVVPLPAQGAHADESAVLWVGGLEYVCVIPGVSRFWDAQLRKGAGGGVNLFSGAQPTRMIRLQDLSTGLLGERCCGVGGLVNWDRPREGDGGLPIDVVVRGETRIVVVREADDGSNGGSGKMGGIFGLRRRDMRDRGSRSHASAIIVRSQRNRSMYDLTVSKAGILEAAARSARGLMEEEENEEQEEEENGRSSRAQEEVADNATLGSASALFGRSRVGFSFADTMNAAADVREDVRRDVEVEMLDIMDLERQLDSMEERREKGGKRVLFEDDN